MKLHERTSSRRAVAGSGVAAAAAWASRPFIQPASAQAQVAEIIAVRVEQAPVDPDDPYWEAAAAVEIPLLPQNIVLPRVTEAGVEVVAVRALLDAERIGFLLEWRDARPDMDLGTVSQYRDAVAIQFPADLSLPTPSILMGQTDNPVIIYHWKSDWQFGPTYDVDEAYPNMHNDWYPFSGVPAGEIPEATDYITGGRPEYLTAAAVGNTLADPLAQKSIGPVQKMRAEGFGTIEPDQTQDARGSGAWRDGVWRIAIAVPRTQAAFAFSEGMVIPVAFAVWDGSRGERNGQKAFSPTWHNLSEALPARSA